MNKYSTPRPVVKEKKLDVCLYKITRSDTGFKDFLKIEGEFIKTLSNSPKDRVFIEGIVSVAKKMGIKTIAEFVENEKVLEVVKDLGIDYAQGYYLGKPEPLEEKLKKYFSKV
jgi:EAL domain-containing protein (putative c-di-GMP-specific phosphodiesterase class I)